MEGRKKISKYWKEKIDGWMKGRKEKIDGRKEGRKEGRK